ncbi:MAG: universal stress protein [Devosiaceae bacterium]|nr:universal stress protein [Devosiaceae bacterium]
MGNKSQDIPHDYTRKFLVVIDETDECDRAVTFAAHRVLRTGGTVVLLSIVGSDEFQHWLGVKDVLRAESLEQAEDLLEQRARHIREIGNIGVEKIVREGRKAEQIEKLISSDKQIAILVLASGTSSEGPGPLVSAFAGRGSKALPIPVTIVPGNLSDEDIIALC